VALAIRLARSFDHFMGAAAGRSRDTQSGALEVVEQAPNQRSGRLIGGGEGQAAAAEPLDLVL